VSKEAAGNPKTEKRGSDNLFTGPGRVNQIPQQDDVLLTGKPACRDGPWAFLQSDLLVVAIHGLPGDEETKSEKTRLIRKKEEKKGEVKPVRR